MIFEGNCAEQCFSMAQSGYVVRFETPGARATLAPREEMLGESQRTWVQLWQPLPASRVVPPLSLIVQHRCDSFIRAMGATLEALIAAFCRLDKSLSCCWEKGWLVGAVGIEPRVLAANRTARTTASRRGALMTAFCVYKLDIHNLI